MNATSTPGPLAEALGRATYEFYKAKPLLPTYLHILVSSIFPIYTAAHASLVRPTSAAAAKKKTATKRTDDDEDEEELSPKIETLTVSDAVLFPILAGITLATLYFIIKWLEDPALLNKILGIYFSWIGTFFTFKFFKDFLGFFRSVAFPTQYSAGGRLWRLSGIGHDRFITKSNDGTIRERSSPLPGVVLGAIPLPQGVCSLLWKFRSMLYHRTTLQLHTNSPLPKSRLKIRLSPFIDSIAFTAAFSLLIYQLVSQNSKTWYFTNLSGFAFCHGSLQFLTPGTSGVGSLLLSLLFFYDIYMVFYTPMMVTVATKLDVPIKLLFPRPDGCVLPVGAPEGSTAMKEYLDCLAKKRTMAMLGLGDIVIPGMMIAFALRFDLYRYYLDLQNTNPATPVKQVVSKKGEPKKPVYMPARGSWGERLWTSQFHRLNHPDCATLRAKGFPKPYFFASLIGYVMGMVTTLLIMQVFQHAQPALLYLVPGVLASLWGTALVKGDLKLLWRYDESGEEKDQNKTEKDGNKDKATDAKQDEEKEGTEEKVESAGDTSNGSAEAKETPSDKAGNDKEQRKSQKSSHFKFTSLSNLSFSIGSILECSIQPLRVSSSAKSETGTPSTSMTTISPGGRSITRSGRVFNQPETPSKASNDSFNESNPSSPELISKEEAMEAEATGIALNRRDGQEPPGKRRRKA